MGVSELCFDCERWIDNFLSRHDTSCSDSDFITANDRMVNPDNDAIIAYSNTMNDTVFFSSEICVDHACAAAGFGTQCSYNRYR